MVPRKGRGARGGREGIGEERKGNSRRWRRVGRERVE